MTTGAQRDIHAQITDQIVAAIEKGAGDFRMPWHRGGRSLTRPENITSRKRYRGINVVALWLAAEAAGYSRPVWGTYRQWLGKGAQVRRGERSSLIVFYKEIEAAADDAGDGEASRRTAVARASHVFNADQVDGYVSAEDAAPAPAAPIDPIAAADELVRTSGAVVREGGVRAFFSPAGDFIGMPDRNRFVGSGTMSATEAWYATLLHELTHWSGGKARLDREFGKRFGDNAYAMEELTAELGAAYLCADLGVTTELRPDHAAYIAAWLKVMRADKRAVFTVAAKAQTAADYLLGFAPTSLRPENTASVDVADAGVDTTPAAPTSLPTRSPAAPRPQ